MKEASMIQLIMALIILISSIIFSTAPLYVKSFQSRPLISALGNCFSGGVFLSVGITHLLAEGNETLSSLTPDEMPLGYLLAIVGYFLILMIERILFVSHDEVNFARSREFETADRGSNLIERRNGEEQIDLEIPNKLKQQRVMRGIIMGIALTIHSLFEGIAIGLQDTVVSTLSVGLAVCVHKLPAALALGITLIYAKRIKAFIMLLIFSSSSPVGIFIGMILQTMNAPALEGVFMSLCAGTFLYIAASDVITEEFSKSKHRWWKFLALWIGFLVSAGLILVLED